MTATDQLLFQGADWDFRTLQRKANPLGKTLFSIIGPQHRQIVSWLYAKGATDIAAMSDLPLELRATLGEHATRRCRDLRCQLVDVLDLATLDLADSHLPPAWLPARSSPRPAPAR